LAILSIILISFIPSSNADCANPLFGIGACGGLTCSIQYLGTPDVKPDVPICPNIAVGAQTCCSSTVFDAINNAWTLIKTTMDTTIQTLQVTQASLQDEFQPLLDNLRTSLDQEYPNLSDDDKDRVVDDFRQIIDIMGSFFGSVFDNFPPCASGILKYVAGIICFGCDPDWTRYVYRDTNTGYISVAVAVDTCDSLADACAPLLDSFVAGFSDANTLFADIQRILGQSDSSLDIFQIDDVCNGNCRAFVCNSMVSGNAYSVGFVGFGGGNFDSGSFSKREEETAGPFEARKNLLSKVHPGFAMKYVEHMNALMSPLRDLQAFSKNSVTLRTGNVGNNYTSDGYPAYTVGSGSGLDTDVNGAESLTTWINYISALLF